MAGTYSMVGSSWPRVKDKTCTLCNGEVHMKKQTVLLLASVLAILLACQSLAPARVPIPTSTAISTATETPAPPTATQAATSACAEIVTALAKIQPDKIPEHLLKTGVRQADDFDANKYFEVLTHLSMQAGYALDYVYEADSLGGFPLLYARPVDQAPYASMEDVPAERKLPDYLKYVEVEDVEQGYFEYVVMNLMAGRFYLSWHANYNDTQIVCNRQAVEDIIASINAGDFGNKLDLIQQAKARAIENIEPVVTLAGGVATVEIVTFTKWGGFYRVTYAIRRQFPHTIIDSKEENLVPYQCGVMF